MFKWFFCLLALLMVGSSASAAAAAAAGATPAAKIEQGELKGKVTIVPNCPGEKACVPSSRQIRESLLSVTTLTGENVTIAPMSNEGRFSVKLNPGTYRIKTLGAFPTMRGYGPTKVVGLPADVSIKAGQATELNFRLEDWDLE